MSPIRRSTAARGALRLVGRVKWLLDPDYRGASLGTMLVNQFIDTAHQHDMIKMVIKL